MYISQTLFEDYTFLPCKTHSLPFESNLANSLRLYTDQNEVGSVKMLWY